MLLIYLLPVAFPSLRMTLNDMTVVFMREPRIETDSQILRENRMFREKLEENKYQLSQVEGLLKENTELKKAQKLGVGRGYSLSLLTIAHRHPVTWNEKFTLKKNKTDLAPTGTAVLVGGKLAGKIVRTGKITADVETLWSPNVEVACVIQGTEWFGLLKGRDTDINSTELICKLDNLPRDVEIKDGSLVYTSGVGVLPGGIEVAKVIKTERNEIKQLAYVQLLAPINSARFASLLIKDDE